MIGKEDGEEHDGEAEHDGEVGPSAMKWNGDGGEEGGETEDEEDIEEV